MMPKDYSAFSPSQRAQENYRKLELFNKICYGLLAVMVVLGIWNIIEVATLIRSGVRDLADIASIMDHISSRLILGVGAVALAIFIFKEWKYGERGFAGVYFLAALLFLGLVPTMSAEIQPAEEDLLVSLTYNVCDPDAVEGGVVIDSSLCLLQEPDNYNVMLAASNPQESDAERQAPGGQDSVGVNWTINGRGNVRVYAMVEQQSLEICESSKVANNTDGYGHFCMEEDGTAWLVQPFEVSSATGNRLVIHQEFAP